MLFLNILLSIDISIYSLQKLFNQIWSKVKLCNQIFLVIYYLRIGFTRFMPNLEYSCNLDVREHIKVILVI